MAVLYTKEYAPRIGLGIACVGGGKALDTYLKKDAVDSYFAKNPNTNFSSGALYNALKEAPDGGYAVDQSKLKGK